MYNLADAHVTAALSLAFQGRHPFPRFYSFDNHRRITQPLYLPYSLNPNTLPQHTRASIECWPPRIRHARGKNGVERDTTLTRFPERGLQSTITSAVDLTQFLSQPWLTHRQRLHVPLFLRHRLPSPTISLPRMADPAHLALSHLPCL